MTAQPEFILFGTAHSLTITLTLLIVILVPLLLKNLKFQNKIRVSMALATLLIINEIANMFISTYIYGNPLIYSLPLHLCGMAALLTAWMLYQHSYRAYEVAYFWAVGGSIPAMLTPDLIVGFPHFSFIKFFFAHGLIIMGVIYATIVFEFRPTLLSVAKAVGAAIVLMIFIALIDYLLDANYMYLFEKPVQNTMMDFMGPWPWYILSLIVIGTLIMFLCYLPFIFIRNNKI